MSDEPDYWKNDLLGRQEDAQLLHQFLVRRMDERQSIGKTGSYVLNLDAGWGQGKTFFLTGFKELLESEGHKVVLVNAWEDDYADDPLLAVVSAIERAFPEGKGKTAAKKLAEVGSQIAATAAKHVVRTMLAKVVGAEGVKEIIDASGALGKAGADTAAELADQTTKAAGKALLARFADGKEAIADFRATLRALIEKSELKLPLFILIDEVDRCRPSYAITLLERVKQDAVSKDCPWRLDPRKYGGCGCYAVDLTAPTRPPDLPPDLRAFHVIKGGKG